MPFIDALILNKLHIAELSENNEVELLYGIEVKEFNLTNRINVNLHLTLAPLLRGGNSDRSERRLV